jgi:hypothetical protein
VSDAVALRYTVKSGGGLTRAGECVQAVRPRGVHQRAAAVARGGVPPLPGGHGVGRGVARGRTAGGGGGGRFVGGGGERER